MSANEFICPECGSHRARPKVFVSAVIREGNPWSVVLQRVQCAKCSAMVPAHLAERWDGMSEGEAQAEWQQTYRAKQPTADL